MRYLGWMIGALLAVAATTSALARDMTPRQVADAYLAAWNAHDPDAAAALMADDVTYRGRSRAGPPFFFTRMAPAPMSLVA